MKEAGEEETMQVGRDDTKPRRWQHGSDRGGGGCGGGSGGDGGGGTELELLAEVMVGYSLQLPSRYITVLSPQGSPGTFL